MESHDTFHPFPRLPIELRRKIWVDSFEPQVIGIGDKDGRQGRARVGKWVFGRLACSNLAMVRRNSSQGKDRFAAAMEPAASPPFPFNRGFNFEVFEKVREAETSMYILQQYFSRHASKATPPLLRTSSEARAIALEHYAPRFGDSLSHQIYFNPKMDTLWFWSIQDLCIFYGSGEKDLEVIRNIACPLTADYRPSVCRSLLCLVVIKSCHLDEMILLSPGAGDYGSDTEELRSDLIKKGFSNLEKAYLRPLRSEAGPKENYLRVHNWGREIKECHQPVILTMPAADFAGSNANISVLKQTLTDKTYRQEVRE